MPNAEYDLRYLQAGLGLLEKYLQSSDLYWPIGTNAPAGSPPYPQLTLSGMLLAKLRAQARSSTPTELSEFAKLAEELDQVRSKWRVAWGNKAAAEFRSRLNLWRNFIEEYRDDHGGNANRYSYEVQRRVQLQLLAEEADSLPEAERSLLSGMDRLLQSLLVSGDFIWPAELQPSFPRDPYWYLYGRLKEE